MSALAILFAASFSAGATAKTEFAHDPVQKSAKSASYVADKTRVCGVAANVMAKTVAEPEGDEKVYVTNWMQMFGNYIVDNTGLAHRVRFASDGAVYFYDFMSMGLDYWIEGEIDENGIITIPTHQVIPQYEVMKDYKVDLTLELSTFEFEDDVMYSAIDLDADSFTLKLQPDGSIVSTDIDLPWEERVYPVAFYKDKVYALCGAMTMVPCSDEVVTPPSDIAPQDYSYSYRQQDLFAKANLVKGIIDGDDFYVQGLCPSIPEEWLKGRFNADHSKLIFESGQYIGYGQYHHFFSAAHHNPDANPDDPSVPNWLQDDELVLTVSPDGKGFVFDYDRYLAVTINGDVSYVLRSSKLTPAPPAKYAAPMKPVITAGNELLWIEADFLPFVQPNVDVDGNYLDVKNLSWRMYYDDELFTFDPSEYGIFVNPETELPYCFEDRWDFIVYEDVMEQCVCIYRTDYRTIGVESVYRDGDECYVSERAYFYNPTVSADEIEADRQTVGCEYFDISGRG